MQCDYPLLIKKAGDKLKNGTMAKQNIFIKCGRCYGCKMTRVRQWIFRLQKEYNSSVIGHFLTLTYDTNNVPITPNRFMTLDKEDVQKYLKRLRKLEQGPNKKPIKYYAVGEYGTKNSRPHIHLIIFNVYDPENMNRAWKLGQTHWGSVTQASIAYTLEYITTKSAVNKKHSRDDRKKEFTLISKNIGKSYLSKNVIAYHKENKLDMYITIEDGTKIAMPRYYRDKIFTESDKEEQLIHISEAMDIKRFKDLDKYGEVALDKQKAARAAKLNKFKNHKKI